jgi:hypothetical protein
VVVVTAAQTTSNGALTEEQLSSLSTAAARNLATTTKTQPQMQGISSRWLLRVLPWVDVAAGTYRVNRRLTYEPGTGRVTFSVAGDAIHVVPPTLAEIPALATVDPALLDSIAAGFTRHTYETGDTIGAVGNPAQLVLVAHGKVTTAVPGKYGASVTLGNLADGDHVGAETLYQDATWPYTVTALTRTTTLQLTRDAVTRLAAAIPAPVPHDTNKRGEATIHLTAGHTGEPAITGTFVDYELSPREYELSLAQTILRVHTRVADLYNQPHNQTEQQLRLTIEALRERQEHELLNNTDFGLLHNADLTQRIPTRDGAPTPYDLDELLRRRRKTQFFLGPPQAIAAFGRECTARGIYPEDVEYDGRTVRAWRGVPFLPCNKIPITAQNTTSIIAMRTGEENQGVIGLRHVGLADEYEPGLSVRFMGANEQAVMSYLVSTYHSAAILVPDAFGVLEQVELGR